MTDRPPAKRADAARNRQRILDAARTAFAATGAETSMAEIARRSGVGQATLYRNFATRHELLEALLVDEVDEVRAAAATVAGDSPGERPRPGCVGSSSTSPPSGRSSSGCWSTPTEPIPSSTAGAGCSRPAAVLRRPGRAPDHRRPRPRPDPRPRGGHREDLRRPGIPAADPRRGTRRTARGRHLMPTPYGARQRGQPGRRASGSRDACRSRTARATSAGASNGWLCPLAICR
jgi:AcrR family transcriptional regulator